MLRNARRAGRGYNLYYMNNIEAQRTPCEIYSRVVGYLRPVKQWNDAKQAEFMVRKTFNSQTDHCC